MDGAFDLSDIVVYMAAVTLDDAGDGRDLYPDRNSQGQPSGSLLLSEVSAGADAAASL